MVKVHHLDGDKTSKRFQSESNAKDFASKVNGTLTNTKGNPEAKHNFKVSYTRDINREGK